jgi:hypothetical protein
MDRLTRYREIVRRVLEDYVHPGPSYGDIDVELVIDPERDHYQIVHVGWHGYRRIHGTVIHVDIIDGKIWIQYDGTDRPVADELLEAGVPKEDIVLAFHPPELRIHTGFAVG